MAVRFDISENIPVAEKLPDGRLRATASLTRAGVFLYSTPDGSMRREWRPPSEVFEPESLRSFAMTTVTDDHPPGLLTSKNARKYAVGSIGEVVRQDGDHVMAAITVFDEEVIAKMDSGKRQVSLGYTCEMEVTPGMTPQGEAYDAIQRKIRGNHAAIVSEGRVGPTARVHLDSAEPTERWDSAEMIIDDKGNEKMDELKKELAVAVAALATAKESEKTAVARADKAEAERDSEKSARELADKTRSDAAELLPKTVRARVDLENKAIQCLGAEVKLDTMTDRAIRAAVIKKLDGADIEESRSEDYVTARFDAAIEHSARADKANQNLLSVANAPRSEVQDAGSARELMIKANREIWKA